jgi:hypothetical protein
MFLFLILSATYLLMPKECSSFYSFKRGDVLSYHQLACGDGRNLAAV